jgi:TolA-binding protein
MFAFCCSVVQVCNLNARAEEPPLLSSARRALAESLPQIAIQKLKSGLASNGIAGGDRDPAVRLLAEALLETGEYDDALAVSAELAGRGDAEARLWRAHILASAGRWAEALPLYQELGRAPGAPTAARLGEAEALQALGRTAQAVPVLEAAARAEPRNLAIQLRLAGLQIELQKPKKARALLENLHPVEASDLKWKQYVEGRLLLAEGHAAPALAIFDEVVREPRGLSESLLAGATIGAAEARAILRGYDAADRPLETFIWRYPESPWLEVVFARLDRIYAQQENPAESELQKWAAKQPPRCAALARFYVARMQIRSRKQDKAAWSLDVFVQTYPTHPLLPFAHLMRADLLLEKRDLEAAVRALDAAERAVKGSAQRAEIELRRGLVLYEQGQYLLAANEFRRAGEHSAKLRENALFDAALAALKQKNYERFLVEYRALIARYPESPLRSDLILEQGLVQARSDDPRAEETLQLYLNHFPLAGRQAEARLALAELAFQGADPRTAAQYLRTAAVSPGPPETTEHGDYLAVFLAEAQTGKENKVIEQAQAFIRKHPKSELLPEVRMKLGQVFFRAGDFASAETQFATLAQENPTSAYTETALFLAGESAMQSINPGAVERALKLFDEVVKREGPLKLYARQQQAIIQGKLGKESEAVTLYDAILSAPAPPEPELRYAAMAAKGENLLILGRKDKKVLDAALGVFDQLATLPEVPIAWRNQALYKKATALEKLGRLPEALTAYYDVLEQDRTEAREFFWFYKAGFDLAAIFEQQGNWKSAIGIYERIARLEGPRAADALSRAKDLRLKHFIWE